MRETDRQTETERGRRERENRQTRQAGRQRNRYIRRQTIMRETERGGGPREKNSKTTT